MSEQTTLVQPEAKKGREGERRAWVRYQCSREASYSSLPTYERFWATVRDISVDGIGLILSTAVEPGTYLIIEMKTTSRPISLTMLARVTHSTPRDEGGWAVGCELVTKPTEEQLRSLL